MEWREDQISYKKGVKVWYRGGAFCHIFEHKFIFLFLHNSYEKINIFNGNRYLQRDSFQKVGVLDQVGGLTVWRLGVGELYKIS